MTDYLYITYDNNNQDLSALSVGRKNKDGSLSILKMILDKEADDIYKYLIEQSAKIGKGRGEVWNKQ